MGFVIDGLAGESIMSESGRGIWWDVYMTQGRNRTRLISGNTLRPDDVGVHLDAWIAKHAAKDCPDCIAAILECPDDEILQQHVREQRHD